MKLRDNLPWALALLLGATLFGISHGFSSIFVMGIVALAQYFQRGVILHPVLKWGYVAFGGVFGMAFIVAGLHGLVPLMVLSGVGLAFCVSVLYARMEA